MASYTTKDTGLGRRKFKGGAVRDMATGKGRYDLLPILALRRIAQLYERGAVKYAARNWEKGMPAAVMIDSAKRHVDQFIEGRDDEDHLAGAVFNLLGIMEQEERKRLGMTQYEKFYDGMGPLFEFNRRGKGGNQ